MRRPVLDGDDGGTAFVCRDQGFEVTKHGALPGIPELGALADADRGVQGLCALVTLITLTATPSSCSRRAASTASGTMIPPVAMCTTSRIGQIRRVDGPVDQAIAPGQDLPAQFVFAEAERGAPASSDWSIGLVESRR